MLFTSDVRFLLSLFPNTLPCQLMGTEHADTAVKNQSSDVFESEL